MVSLLLLAGVVISLGLGIGAISTKKVMFSKTREIHGRTTVVVGIIATLIGVLLAVFLVFMLTSFKGQF